jgi:hypothetical protein
MKRFIDNFRRWLAHLLLPSEPETPLLAAINVPELPPTSPITHTPIAAQPGLVCPQCEAKIAITIPMLLSGQPFYCTGCFLEISVNQTESAAALNALQTLQGEFQKAEAIVRQAKS